MNTMIKSNRTVVQFQRLVTFQRKALEQYPEYRDPVLVKETIRDSDATRKEAVIYTDRHGMEVAIVYLHDLCELE